MVEHADLLRLFSYDPDTGVLSRRESSGKCAAGVHAGRLHRKGYRYVKIMGREYAAHRLAWLYVYGVWPSRQIDHVNGVRDDNRISNLRDVSAQQNQHNRRRPPKNSSSGRIGVHRCDGKWRASIKVGGQAINLGMFDSVDAAADAYQAAKKRVHFGVGDENASPLQFTGPSGTYPVCGSRVSHPV